MATVIRKSSGGVAYVDNDFVRIDWGPNEARGYQGANVSAGGSTTFTIPEGHRVAIATVYVTSSNQVQCCTLGAHDSHVLVAKEVSRSGWLASYLSNSQWGHEQQVVTYYFETDGEAATFQLRSTVSGYYHHLKVFLSAVPE